MSADDVRSALRHYPREIADLGWQPLGPAGGFSGACVWRGDSAPNRPMFALKAWPVGYPAERLRRVHAEMARAGLPFVPAITRASSGDTVVKVAGRVWDVTAWMPGTPALAAAPTDASLSAAMAALAALHRAWAPAAPASGECPGVTRRMAVVHRVLRGVIPPPSPDDTTRHVLQLLPRFAHKTAEALHSYIGRRFPLQVCVRDCRAEHVLFENDRVTGLIDYGAASVDHPAVDLARLLGDAIGADPARLRHATGQYRAAGGAAGVEPDFVQALADAGLIGGTLYWLDRMAGGMPLDGPGEWRFRQLAAALGARCRRAW